MLSFGNNFFLMSDIYELLKNNIFKLLCYHYNQFITIYQIFFYFRSFVSFEKDNQGYNNQGFFCCLCYNLEINFN